jgi:hypothetical protein
MIKVRSERYKLVFYFVSISANIYIYSCVVGPHTHIMGVLLEIYKVTIKTFSPFTIHSAAHISPRTWFCVSRRNICAITS